MANFKIKETDEDITSFDLPANRVVTLLQWGGDGSYNKLHVKILGGSPDVTVAALDDKLPAASTAFVIEGKRPGVTVKVSACVAGTEQRYTGQDLTVNVKGEAKKHSRYTIDLISDLATNGTAADIQLYTKMMTSPAPVLQQNITEGSYNCGDVSRDYGKNIFKKPTSLTYYAYYKTPTSDKMADLRFDATQLRSAVERIQSRLRQGFSVPVWLIHDDGFGKVIQRTDPTHFVAIVGFSPPNKFLYIDPWPDGSKFPYDGGMYPPRRSPPTFFGQFEFDPSNLELGIKQSPESLGSMAYTVIAGP